MKKILIACSLLFVTILSFATQDLPENAGDNLDLNEVLNLFEKSASVEDFENQLNSEKNNVNNLDLNEDGFVDYIRVIDYSYGNTHSLTLQVPYSDKEAQDVAVIQIEEEGDLSTVQIIGDEDLYGEGYIIEPGTADSKEIVNVYNWKPIRHIYSPKYVIWVSPWRYGRFPAHYKPWKPVPWMTYRARVRHNHIPCRRVSIYRSHKAHNYYRKYRTHSPTYHTHHGHKSAGAKKKTKNAKPAPAPQKSSNLKTSAGKPTKRPGGTKNSSSKNKSGGKNKTKKRR